MEFEVCKRLWQDADEAFLGSGGYLNGKNLIKYVREDDAKFRDRQDLAYYTNILVSKINRYVGYIYKKLPIRTVNDDLLSQILITAIIKVITSMFLWMSSQLVLKFVVWVLFL